MRHIIRTLACGLAFTASLLAFAGAAPPAPDIAGTWSGMLDFPNAQLLFVITIANVDGTLSATAQSPYQGEGILPLDRVAQSGTTFTFSDTRHAYSFTGTITTGAITGTFTQGGASVPLTLVPSSLGTSDLAGTWLGTLHAGSANLLLGLRIAHGPNGALTAVLDSPAQHAVGMAITTIAAAGGTLTFSIANIGATYAGRIGSDSIAGTFTQGGMHFPLTFVRPGPDIAVATPAPVASPYPLAPARYESRDVQFASTGGAVLSGTLSIPNALRRRVPAFVFVHGSGPGTRDGALPQNPTFLDLANALSNAGYAVLRYDKRGIRRSTGTPTEDWRPLSEDVRAAVAFLRRQPGIDPRRIILVGHSEGGLVVPLAAPSTPGVAGIVLMAPPAISMQALLAEQSVRMTPAIYAALRQAFAAYDGIDPAAVIRRVDVPILVLQGTRDIQVLPSDLHHLVDAARAAHRRITVRLLSGDDHLFIHVPAGASGGSEYEIPAPLDPRVAADILAWMHANGL